MNAFGYLSYILLGITVMILLFRPEDISNTQLYLTAGVFIAMALAAMAESEVNELREWIRRKFELPDSKESDKKKVQTK